MAILALDPAYGLTGSKPALVCLFQEDWGYEFEWHTFRPKKKDLDERLYEILDEINNFASRCDRTTLRTLAVYKTAYGGAALGLTEVVGMFRGWGYMEGITEFHKVADKSVKAAIAGHGNASKEAVALAVKAQWPDVPEGELDVSDAAALALFVANRKGRKQNP